ncbi:MAG: serine/threonine protein kinase [Polyangiaceae bacterium]|nr:serine/threonine protein kinase [Polyangiaceae bacterium]
MSKLPTAIGQDARFIVDGLLGTGDWAQVYRARDRRTGMRVAVKVSKGRSHGHRQRLEEEFSVLQRLDHPNLTRHFDLYLERSEAFFTLELVEGEDLVSAIRAGAKRRQSADGSEFSPLPQAGLLRLSRAFPQLVSAVETLHGAGLVHRDLTRENVRLAFDGRVVVLDYGLVERPRVGGRGPSALAGVPAYMAPEQHDALERGPASDWYSVGVLLFESLTGALPFAGDDFDVVVRKRTLDPPRAGTLVVGVPPGLDALAWDLLQRAPERRPTGREIIHRLALDTT